MARVLSALGGIAIASAATQLTVSFDASKPLNTVDERYINFNIDTGSIFNGLDFFDPKLRNLAKQLAPAYVRVGGTAVDYSFFYPDVPYNVGQINGNAAGDTSFGTALLDALVEFTLATGLELLYDFNGLSFRNPPTGPWDPKGNATAILDYIQSKYAGHNFSWAMGNEPDLWKVKVPISQLAADAVTLKKVLTSGRYSIGTDVYGSSFAGIEASEASAYLPGARAAITGFTAHDYPYARNCNLASYLNKKYVTDGMAQAMRGVAAVAAQSGLRPGTLLVVEETAGSYGGGCVNITDRFSSGFAWLPIINAVAASGFQRVHRQDIVGWSFAFGMSNYQLVGPPGWTNGSAASLTPHPDWFTTILAKQILGPAVLNTSAAGSANTSAYDVHVWCARGGGVAVAWTNLGGDDVTLSLGAALDAQARVEFTLTSTASAGAAAGAGGAPPPPSLQDDAVYLNGALMAVDGETGLLPVYPIPGRAVQAGAGALLTPAYAYGFAVYPGAAVAACQA